MRAVVIESFTTAQGTHQIGQVIQVCESLLARLQGKVRPLEQDDLHQLVTKTMLEINAAGWPWEGFSQRLPPKALKSIKAIEARIDSTCGEGNREELAAALLDYREACLQARNGQRKGKTGDDQQDQDRHPCG